MAYFYLGPVGFMVLLWLVGFCMHQEVAWSLKPLSVEATSSSKEVCNLFADVWSHVGMPFLVCSCGTCWSCTWPQIIHGRSWDHWPRILLYHTSAVCFVMPVSFEHWEKNKFPLNWNEKLRFLTISERLSMSVYIQPQTLSLMSILNLFEAGA